MTGHLSEQQIFEWLLGEQPAAVHYHLSMCDCCCSELAQMERALGGFRSSVQSWSRSKEHVVGIGWNRWSFKQWSSRQLSYNHLPAWIWTATAAITACLLAAYHLTTLIPAQTAAADNFMTDAVLLEQIDQQLSRTVAGPMEPLSRRVSWKEDSPFSRHRLPQSKSVKYRD